MYKKSVVLPHLQEKSKCDFESHFTYWHFYIALSQCFSSKQKFLWLVIQFKLSVMAREVFWGLARKQWLFMGCLQSWHFRRDNKTYIKEEEGTDCKETKLGKYFDCRGSWLVKGSLSVYNTVYFPANFGYWIARQLWRRLPSSGTVFMAH